MQLQLGRNMRERAVKTSLVFSFLFLLWGCVTAASAQESHTHLAGAERWRNISCTRISDASKVKCISAHKSMGLPPALPHPPLSPNASVLERDCWNEAARIGVLGEDFKEWMTGCEREKRDRERIAKERADDQERIARERADASRMLREARHDQEAIREALDAHLAAVLKDPVSAIQYGVSDVTLCDSVVAFSSRVLCVCYRVNAKNSMGGYTGIQFGVVALVGKQAPFLVEDVEGALLTRPDSCKNIVPRDSARIHALVR